MPADVAAAQLLHLLQAEFPLSPQPFTRLASMSSMGSDEVMRRIEHLKKEGIVRMIGPVLEPHKLGYRTTLAAMNVPKSGLEQACRMLAVHPAISHAYERTHLFNLWFTLALPATSDVEEEVRRIADKAGAENFLSLPALRMFKITAYFDVGGGNRPKNVSSGTVEDSSSDALSAIDGAILSELQQDLPLIPEPFSPMAHTLGMETEEFLDGVRSLIRRKVIRRYSASVSHGKMGFTANGMCCWNVPENRIDAAGKMLASLPQVSHCYIRKTGPFWPYNLFAMVHGRSRKLCEETVSKVSSETGLYDRVLLYSTREIKKTRILYQI